MIDNLNTLGATDALANTDSYDSIDEFDLSASLDALENHGDGDSPMHATSDNATVPRRNPMNLLAKIPVQLTLEVGTATLSLAALMAVNPGTVLELDHIAGEPLRIKINGTDIGRGEVVVSGRNYALRVVDLDDLTDLEHMPS